MIIEAAKRLMVAAACYWKVKKNGKLKLKCDD
jgi:hypothetical protein